MLFLASLSFSVNFSPFTGVVYPQTSVNATLPSGRYARFWGAFFPQGGSFNLTDEDASALAITTTFPKLCTEVIVSTKASEDVLLDQGIGAHEPRSDSVCFWYVSRPSRFTISASVGVEETLRVENIDGVPVSEKLSTGNVTYLLNQSILVRWLHSSRDSDAFARVTAIQRDDSIPYLSRSVQFTFGSAPYYFPVIGLDRRATVRTWVAGIAGVGLVAVFAAKFVGVRMGARPEAELLGAE